MRPISSSKVISNASANLITVSIFGFFIPPRSIFIIVLYEIPDSTANFSCDQFFYQLIELFDKYKVNFISVTEIFMHTLHQFIKILPQKKSIDKSLWVKKFIKKIDYSKDEIVICIYYRENFREVAAKNDDSNKEEPGSEYMNWLSSMVRIKNES